jgi:hypothetical protein
MGIAWLPCDLSFFGVPISSRENKTFSFLRNETVSSIYDVIEGVADDCWQRVFLDRNFEDLLPN